MTPGPPPRQPDPTLKGYLEEANHGMSDVELNEALFFIAASGTDDLEERYTLCLRRRHPIKAWLSDLRRWRQRSSSSR